MLQIADINGVVDNSELVKLIITHCHWDSEDALMVARWLR